MKTHFPQLIEMAQQSTFLQAEVDLTPFESPGVDLIVKLSMSRLNVVVNRAWIDRLTEFFVTSLSNFKTADQKHHHTPSTVEEEQGQRIHADIRIEVRTLCEKLTTQIVYFLKRHLM